MTGLYARVWPVNASSSCIRLAHANTNLGLQTYISSSNNTRWGRLNKPFWTAELKCSDTVRWQQQNSRACDYILMFTDFDVCHATGKVILDCCSPDLRGCTLYTLFFPCNKCALVIIQSGMKNFVHYNDKICPFHEGFHTKEHRKGDEQGEKKRASMKLLDHARVFYK